MLSYKAKALREVAIKIFLANESATNGFEWLDLGVKRSWSAEKKKVLP